jgi:hypothetical protein
MSKLGDSLAVLRETEFRKLFIGQATSVVGVMFTVVALPFAVLSIGGSATDIGLVEAANLVPLTCSCSSAACGPTVCPDSGSCLSRTSCASRSSASPRRC